MYDILFCISTDHDLRLVILAAAVCLLSTMTATLMLGQSSMTSGKEANRWTAVAGFATGFGIWATHFIAMLGYDPGIIAGYKVNLTLASLGIVLAATIASFRLATTVRTKWGIAAASVLAGSGVAAMHYVGMAALEMPALISWRTPYVLLSLVLAIVPFYPALTLAVRSRNLQTSVAAALIMACAIIGLHFSGMTAIRLIPSQMLIEAGLISPRILSVLIGTISIGLLATCVTSWIIARRSRAAIAASDRQLSVLVHAISDCAICMLDRSGHIANWNAGSQHLQGYLGEEVLGHSFALLYSAEGRLAGDPATDFAIAETSGKFTGEGWRRRKDGSRFWAHVTIERLINEAGEIMGFAKITRDMTRFKEDQDRIEEARRHLDAALEHMHHGICLFDADERLLLRNRRFADLWRVPQLSCQPGSTLMEIAHTALTARTGSEVSPERLENMRGLLYQSLGHADSAPVIAEFDEFIVSIASRALPQGGWVTTFEDVTERRRTEAKIAHMAMHDGLTGLSNRTRFNRWLDAEIEHASARGTQVALVAVDLDRFKEINDAQGHGAGDLVLKKIAEALTEVVRDGEMAARIGGDEFAVAKSVSNAAELAEFVDRVNSCFQTPLGAQDGLGVGASLGIAVFPEDATGREGLLNNADLAMYRAKGSLEENICYYEPGMDESARHRRQLANDLRQAAVRGELHMLYQQQRSLKTNEISGYEALVRWHHPRFGLVSPDEFIPIAEETGEIIHLGEWVLRTACAEAAKWNTDHVIAVNLSSIQLLKADLPEFITNTLLETGLSPRRLELEITETAIIADKARALHSLRQIKALGVSVAIDDFGTGYSSLDTLHSFPFDKIKIDKSFLLQSDQSEQARAIIRAVLALGRSLTIPVLAEGVETQKQLALLMDEGCNEAQGYYFGRPADAPSSIMTEETVVPIRQAG